jgi:pimeloyl-ACP methyl ester carboxylesterase
MNREILTGGRKIFYRVIGNGKPVVFIHGFGEDGEIWKNQVEFLKDKFQLIIPDLPGSGRSSPDNKQFLIEDYAEIVKQMLNAEFSSSSSASAEPGGKVVIIGHSMGGYIALAFAEKYPDSLTGFGLFHSTAYPDSEEKKQARQKGIGFIREHGAFEFLKSASYNLFSQLSRDKMPELIDEFIGSLRNFQDEALVYYYQAMMKRPDRTALLKNLKVPVLFIAGKYDDAIPLDDSLQLCHLPEISYFHILAESGHNGMLEEAEKSNAILNDYLINLS